LNAKDIVAPGHRSIVPIAGRDFRGHTHKGAFGLRVEGVENCFIGNVTVRDITNAKGYDTRLKTAFEVLRRDHPDGVDFLEGTEFLLPSRVLVSDIGEEDNAGMILETFTNNPKGLEPSGFDGARTKRFQVVGISLSSVTNTFVRTARVSGLTSRVGACIGLAVQNGSTNVRLQDIVVTDITAGTNPFVRIASDATEYAFQGFEEGYQTPCGTAVHLDPEVVLKTEPTLRAYNVVNSPYLSLTTLLNYRKSVMETIKSNIAADTTLTSAEKAVEDEKIDGHLARVQEQLSSISTVARTK
jgi:hypothetical protein